MIITQAPKGTQDILPSQSYRWQFIEEKMRQACRAYGYHEVRVPAFEHTELFLRSVGDTTDIVQKEMYTFEDKGGRSITLKPEGTAGVARAVAEHNLLQGTTPLKMYYVYSPVFRYERPQAGRLRELHQFGVEAFGAPSASVDADVIGVALAVLRNVGLSGKLEVNINSIGCPECRPRFQAQLKEYFAEHIGDMCETCRSRLGRNPLRILDCKSPVCKTITDKAPSCLEFLCKECAGHFEALQGYLSQMGTTFMVNPKIVRGLDYYTKTVFEITAEGIGAQSTVCGGGRYDKLLDEIGGESAPGIGFGMGMERLLMAMDAYGVEIPEPSLFDVYIAPLGEAATKEAFRIAHALREMGISAEFDHMQRGMKAQMRFANKARCKITVVLGDNELQTGCVKVRDMSKSQEEEASFSELIQVIQRKLEEK